MKFMVLIRGDERSEAGIPPSDRLLTEMGRYNAEMTEAGVMVGGNGLHPTSAGARVGFSKGDTTVAAGPFGEPTEMIAGFYLLEASSLQDALEWVKRFPNPDDEEFELEVRQVDEEFEP